MNDSTKHPVPTGIELHSKSRVLSISFDDGRSFDLPCEYLRVYSPAAEEKTRKTPVSGREQVNIDRIEPQGSYAIKISFDDGHDTGIYSWDTLHELGRNQEKNWQAYLDKLEAAGLNRNDSEGGPKQIQLMYFAYLAKFLRKESETVEAPPAVKDVSTLLEWLRKRARDKAYLLDDELLRVTVNKQFAEDFTRLADGDEVALVPTNPTPPKPPEQSKRARDDW